MADAHENPEVLPPTPARGAPNWPSSQPVLLIPSQARLDLPHSVCSFRNNGNTRHSIIDRHLGPHLIEPGQTVRDIEMLDRDIEFFRRQAMPRMGRPKVGADGIVIPATLLPTHPVEVLDARPIEVAREEAAAAERMEKLREARLQQNIEQGIEVEKKPTTRYQKK